MAQRGLSLRVEGLKELRRDLKKIDAGLPRQLNAGMKTAVEPVVTGARAGVRSRSGRLSRSVKAYARAATVSVGSRLAYANVVHWGGSTGRGHRPGVPWSGSVKVKPDPFIARAAHEREEQVLDGLADSIDHLVTRHGFK